MSVACRVVCSGVRCVGSVSDVSVSVPTHVSAWCRMCRVVSDPTHLCRIGVGSVSANLTGWCRMCRIGVGSDTFVSDWCRIGVGLVSDVSGGVGSDTFVSDVSDWCRCRLKIVFLLHMPISFLFLLS